MRKSRFSEAQIVAFSRNTTPVFLLLSLPASTAYTPTRYGYGKRHTAAWILPSSSGLSRSKIENGRMRRIIANQTLEIDAMKNVISKNGWGLHNGKPR